MPQCIKLRVKVRVTKRELNQASAPEMFPGASGIHTLLHQNGCARDSKPSRWSNQKSLHFARDRFMVVPWVP